MSGFRASWRKVRLKLEAEQRVNSGLTLYGLRHTVAVILRECGYEERTIADALGQKTIEMARLYTRGADLAKKITGVAKKFGREVNRRRTKVSNLKPSADGRPSKDKSIQDDNGGRTRTRTLDPLIKSPCVRSYFQSHRCKPTPVRPIGSTEELNMPQTNKTCWQMSKAKIVCSNHARRATSHRPRHHDPWHESVRRRSTARGAADATGRGVRRARSIL